MSDKAIENREGFAAEALLQRSQWGGECPGVALDGEVTRVWGAWPRAEGV